MHVSEPTLVCDYHLTPIVVDPDNWVWDIGYIPWACVAIFQFLVVWRFWDSC